MSIKKHLFGFNIAHQNGPLLSGSDAPLRDGQWLVVGHSFYTVARVSIRESTNGGRTVWLRTSDEVVDATRYRKAVGRNWSSDSGLKAVEVLLRDCPFSEHSAQITWLRNHPKGSRISQYHLRPIA